MTAKLQQGTAPWFDMVGVEIVRAAMQIGLSPDLHLSVIERYIDGSELQEGLRQGLRIDVIDGALTYRTGVHSDEIADVVIEVTAKAARKLNLLLSVDPDYEAALAAAVSLGDFRMCGDLGPLGPVFQQAHDPIVERTA